MATSYTCGKCGANISELDLVDAMDHNPITSCPRCSSPFDNVRHLSGKATRSYTFGVFLMGALGVYAVLRAITGLGEDSASQCFGRLLGGSLFLLIAWGLWRKISRPIGKMKKPAAGKFLDI